LLGDTNYDSEEFDAYNLYDKYCVALISYVPAGAQSSKAFLLDMIKKQLKERGDTDVITTDLNGMLAAVFKGREEGEVRDCLNEISRTYHGRVFITIGNTVRDAGKISVSYSNANDLYGNRFIYLHYGVISSADIKRRGGEEEASGADFGEKLFTFMEINDSARLEGCLAEMQNALCRNSYTPEKIKVICITTVLSIKNLIIKSAGEKKAEQFHDETIIGQIGTLNSLHEIIELMKNELTTVSDNLYGKTTKSTMERIVQYIHANYNRELRLEMLASIFGYNSAYLGKVFHQYMGDNFNNYLDKIRITEAKRLLEEGEYKVYEVAEKVGYTNINYFHNKFKKYVGVSPLNYKKSCKEDEETES
jgi:two-component system response regulator YesN